MTEEARFRFDLAGIVDQIDRIKHDPESLPPAQRAVSGGAASVPWPPPS